MFRRDSAGQHVARNFIMRSCFRNVLLGGALVVALGFPVTAYAVTIDEIVGLSRAGVTDAVILALIDRDKTIFAMQPGEILDLQRQGVSERVILAMLSSGRTEGDDAARADAADTAAFIRSRLDVGPDVVIVGHGPDRPNSGYGDRTEAEFGGPVYVVPPYIVGGTVGGGHRRGRGPAQAHPAPPASLGPVAPWNPQMSPFRQPVVPPVSRSQTAPALCYAQVSSRAMWGANAVITECPAVMQGK
jgi:hypothetical protein